MILRKRFFKALSVALLLGTLLTTGVSARDKTISDSAMGNIGIAMSTDGYFAIDSNNSYSGGKLLYSYKYGTTKDNLESPKYPKGTTVKFYNSDGSLSHTDTNLGDTPIFTENNYTSWVANGYTVSVPESSAYNKDEGYKVMQGNVKDSKRVDNWTVINTPFDKGYFEVTGVYAYSDGTYSEPASKVFYVDKSAIKSVSAPDLKVVESKRADSEATLKLTSATKDASTSLSFITVEKPNGLKETIKLTGQSNEQEYSIKINGKYTFTLFSSSGEKSAVVWTESKISGAGTGNTGTAINTIATKPPVVTFDGIPESSRVGESFIMHVNADQDITLNVDGVTYQNTKSVDIEVKTNGTYKYHVVGKNGLSTDAEVEVACYPDTSGGYRINIGSFWKDKGGNILTGEKLPQTGGIAIGTAMLIGSAIAISGVFLLKKKKETLPCCVKDDTTE